MSPALALDLAQADGVRRYAAQLGDDSLILGQRLGEWCGHAPALEVDLALANVALDLIGQAQHFLGYASQFDGGQADADSLAFGRDAIDFTNCLLVEQPNGDFAQTIARQFLFSTAQELILQHLSTSSDVTLAGIAAKAVKEVAYHASLACNWVERLGDGTAESRQRMINGLDWMWRFVDELFEADAALVAAGVAPDPAALRPRWEARITEVLRRASLDRPADRRAVTGGRHGRHSEHLGHILSEMQFLQRAYPGQVW
jgi:ring-1,2-phenylacetyl-CoA epoxidase subunit PaaC